MRGRSSNGGRPSVDHPSDGTRLGLSLLEVITMQSIEFTMEEIELLREILRHKIDEVDVETFRTDAHDFKQMLKHRRELLEHVLTKFSSVPVAV